MAFTTRISQQAATIHAHKRSENSCDDVNWNIHVAAMSSLRSGSLELGTAKQIRTKKTAQQETVSPAIVNSAVSTDASGSIGELVLSVTTVYGRFR